MDESTHPAFLERLRASHHAVHDTATILTGRGYHVEIPDHTESPTHKNFRQHSDSGDLRVLVGVEVKHLSCGFTCAEDFPYAPDFIVDSVFTHDNKPRPPWAYFIWNHGRTHYGIVWGNTRPHWTVKQRHDRNVSRSVPFYMCPLELVDFYEHA